MGVYSGNDVDAAGSAEVTLYTAAGMELVGQQTSAASVPVVIASNQSAVPTSTVDLSPATQNITIQDSASSTLSGANSQTIVIGTPTVGSAATFTFANYSSARIEVSGTWTGTLTSEQSLDGILWTTAPIHQSGTSFTPSSFTNGFIGELSVTGLTNYRIRATAAVTGGATIRVILSSNPISFTLMNNVSIQDATTPTQKLSVSVAGAALISATSLPLPSGAATSANQSSEITLLTSIDAGSAAALGQTTMSASVPVAIASDQSSLSVKEQDTALWVTATGAAAAGVTLTLPAVAAQFHRITLIEMVAYTTATRIGGVNPVLVTTTNLTGSPVWDFASASALGTTDSKIFTFPSPLKSTTVNTATTIVCPATASIIWRINVGYYTAA